MAIERTNNRAERNLKGKSENYRKIWKPLKQGPRLWTFLCVWFGTAILGVTARHLMKTTPEWLSQVGDKKLFEKVTGNLYRMWCSHWCGHSHRDTVLFRKSIREQRKRFYGNMEFEKIVYDNSRRARDCPLSVSGDETITRLYSKKATDIRMRTSKKNESGILNQNLCCSNVGYMYRADGDPVGGGYTLCNLAYPGKIYNYGSTFREKDIGNLLQLIFSCRNYFRHRNVELITDSHFGHIVPISFARLWGVHITSSFRVSRKGTSGIQELSMKKLPKVEIQDILNDMYLEDL